MSLLLHLLRAPWAQALGWSLLHFLWQGALLGALAWGLLTLLRRAPARTRYAVACSFLLAMAAAPVATFLHLGVVAAPAGGTAGLRVVLEGAAPEAVPLALRMQHALAPELPWLVGAWAAGVLLLSLRVLGGWLWVQRLRSRGASPVPAAWHLVLSRLCRDLKVTRTVRILQSALVEVPTVLGWLRPVILLPACALSGLAPAQLEAILAHELAHIRRADFAVNLLQTSVEVLLFYHPAVWWLSGRIRAERELCCDDVAAGLSGDPLVLARALADLEGLREADPRPPSRLALAANGGSLMHRIRHLLHPVRPLPARARAGAIALLAVSLLGAAGAALQKGPAESGAAAPAHPGAPRLRLKILEGDRHLEVRLRGDVKLDPEAQVPVAVGPGGSFRLEGWGAGPSRTYSATAAGSGYTVDGRPQALDSAGQAWLRGALKDVRKAQAAREKARREEARARQMEAKARALQARLAQALSPGVQAELKAEAARARREAAAARIQGGRGRRLLLRERQGELAQAEAELAALQGQMAELQARMARLQQRLRPLAPPVPPPPPAPPKSVAPPPPAPPAPPAADPAHP